MVEGAVSLNMVNPLLGKIALSVFGGFLLQRLLNGKSELAEPHVPDRFVAQPMAVYQERIVWALTPEHDIRKIREIRNYLNENQAQLAEFYRTETPADVAANKIDEMLKAPPEEPLQTDFAIDSTLGT